MGRYKFQIDKPSQEDQIRNSRKPYARPSRTHSDKRNKPRRGGKEDWTESFREEMMREIGIEDEEF